MKLYFYAISQKVRNDKNVGSDFVVNKLFPKFNLMLLRKQSDALSMKILDSRIYYYNP